MTRHQSSPHQIERMVGVAERFRHLTVNQD